MPNKKFTLVSLMVVALLLVINQWQIMSLQSLLQPDESSTAEATITSPTASQNQPTDSSLSADIKAIAAKIIAKGVPAVYGAELNVSFDKAAAAIPILAKYEQDSRPDKLSGEKLDRYIKIGQQTACEFCCGARTLVFTDGRRACGCAHSAAMRGALAYLLDNYGDSMSDSEILTEVNKWKSVFFPGPTVNKYLSQSGQGNQASGLQRQVGGC